MDTITETRPGQRAAAIAAYAVLARFQDHRANGGGFFEVTWNGRAVGVEHTGTRTFTDNPAADATDDALARAWAAGALTQRLIGEARQRAREPHPGRTVRSLATRGKNKGLTGTVRMVRVNHHNTKRTEFELVIDLHGSDEQRVWSVELTQCTDDDAPVYATQITNQAAHQAATLSWPSLVRLLGLRDA